MLATSILIGVSGTILQLHTLEALWKLVLARANARHFASKLHEQAIKCTHNAVPLSFFLLRC